MTTLVGIANGRSTWIGADSQTTWGELATTSMQPKLWRQRGLLIAATGETREADIIRHCIDDLPSPPSRELLAWLRRDFVSAVREARAAHGYAERRSEGPDVGPSLLIGAYGCLFSCTGSYSICEHREFALGSGQAYALGSLHTSVVRWASPRPRIQAALEAAAALDIYTSAPFQIERLGR